MSYEIVRLLAHVLVACKADPGDLHKAVTGYLSERIDHQAEQTMNKVMRTLEEEGDYIKRRQDKR